MGVSSLSLALLALWIGPLWGQDRSGTGPIVPARVSALQARRVPSHDAQRGARRRDGNDRAGSGDDAAIGAALALRDPRRRRSSQASARSAHRRNRQTRLATASDFSGTCSPRRKGFLSFKTVAAGRVFSLLKIFFGSNRDTALADMIQASIMLRYNKRKAWKRQKSSA